MNAIERHYRLVTEQERILDIAGRLLPLTDDMRNDAALQRIAQAELCLNNAVAHLKAVSFLESPEALLEASIARVREQKAEVISFPLTLNNSAG
jgi:hypothetical protein